ncbi:MAG: acyl dehydratase [Gammaproteobacteria bacterium]|jgi:2-methylfumaryl-CoA hydratase|nr:acyl dehydratase [Gammaproteobacteria bacterium]MBT5601879.1 acyl dehydratase [Gammaproteobacteria bacterium]MBT6246618.1 acyl dehydratase [Gammaproteobacteria bacterium]
MTVYVPFFEDFSVGDDLSDVPAITVTEGMAAIHQALFGDRSKLSLDVELCRKVTGRAGLLANNALVCNLAIGQSTIPSQRVLGNLFYRGLHLKNAVFLGDTLTTQTSVIALRQNTIKAGRAATGMVALQMHVTNQHDQTVMLFWRCPMLPCRDPEAETRQADSFESMPASISDQELLKHLPDWSLDHFGRLAKGTKFADFEIGTIIDIEAADTVTCAPELVRMTLNMAMTHTDASRSVYGKRLVYGGHTIAVASSQITRLIPNLCSILAWYQCDHTGPVFEQDILSTRVTIEDTLSLQQGGILKLHVEVTAQRGSEAPAEMQSAKVLDWRLACLTA